MQKKDLYRLLLPYETFYRLIHRRTADIDFEITQKLFEKKYYSNHHGRSLFGSNGISIHRTGKAIP